MRSKRRTSTSVSRREAVALLDKLNRQNSMDRAGLVALGMTKSGIALALLAAAGFCDVWQDGGSVNITAAGTRFMEWLLNLPEVG